MDFGLTEERKQIRCEVRWCARNHLVPGARTFDENKEHPHGMVDRAAEMRLTGPTDPRANEGAGHVNDVDVERSFRDAKIAQIDARTTEIPKTMTARELLKSSTEEDARLLRIRPAEGRLP